MVINLRGVRESGAAFAIPSYFFILMMILTIGTGLFRMFTGSLGAVTNPPQLEQFGETISGVTAFILLHAFSSGTAALTGVEAISNGTTAFKEPRSRNAGITLIWMAFILGSLFLGISYLTRADPCPAIGGRNGHLATGADSFRWTRSALFAGHRWHDGHPDPGGKYRLCRLPTLECHARRRWFYAASVDLSRQSSGVFVWHCFPGGSSLRADHPFSSKRHAA